MRKTAAVSVLLPTYNSSNLIRAAIESILNQSFEDFELIVLNDASQDDTSDILREYSDDRITLHENAANQGISRTLNIGLDLACSDLVARMDADDISHPARLAQQVAFMENNPEIGLSGTWAQRFGSDDIKAMPATSDKQIRANMVFDCCFVHPSVIFRKSLLVAHNLRYEEVPAEDYQLWVQLMRHCKVANIPEFLLYYRVHETQLTAEKKDCIEDFARSVREGQIKNSFPLIAQETLYLFHLFVEGQYSKITPDEVIQLLQELREMNRTTKAFDPACWNEALQQRAARWYKHLRHNPTSNTSNALLKNPQLARQMLGTKRLLKLLWRDLYQ